MEEKWRDTARGDEGSTSGGRGGEGDDHEGEDLSLSETTLNN